MISISLKSQFFPGGLPQEFSSLIACFTRYYIPEVLPLPPSPYANMMDLLQGRNSSCFLIWLCTTHTIMYRCMQTRSQTRHIHAHTETQTHAWMDAHIIYVVSYIIDVDKLLLKDDCEDEFHPRLGYISKKKPGGMAPHYTNIYRCMLTHARDSQNSQCTHQWSKTE